jgi:hypothetical protein
MIEVLKAEERKSVKWTELAAICDFHVTPDMRDTKTATWDVSWLFTHGFDFGDGRMEGEVGRLMAAQKKKPKKETLVGF